MVKYCPKCGTENNNDSTFCRSCGKILSGINTVDKDTNKHSLSSDSRSINTGKGNEIVLFGVVIVLVIAIAIVGAAAFMSFNDNSNDSTNNNLGLSDNDDNIDTNQDIDTVTSSSIPLSEVYGLASTFINSPSSSSIQYKGVTFTKQQCLYIFSKAIDMKNKGLNGNIEFKSFSSPDNPWYGEYASYLTKSEYVDMAQRTIAWMNNHGKAPNYVGIVVAGSYDIGYENLIIIFARIIIDSENSSLPSSINL